MRQEPADRNHQDQDRPDEQRGAAPGEERIPVGAEDAAGQGGSGDHEGAPRLDEGPEGCDPAAVRQERRGADDRHDRLRPDEGREHEGHEQPGAVTGDAADRPRHEGADCDEAVMKGCEFFHGVPGSGAAAG